MTAGQRQRAWLRAFPRKWRTRYGDELSALIEDLEHDNDLSAVDRLDLLRAGLRTRASVQVHRAGLATGAAMVALACALGGLAFAGVFSTSAPARSQRIVLIPPVKQPKPVQIRVVTATQAKKRALEARAVRADLAAIAAACSSQTSLVRSRSCPAHTWG